MPQRAPAATSPPEGDIVSLVAAARDGAPAAFVELHRRFARAVHGIALAHVRASDAEDVTQEVFVRVHARLRTLRELEAFPAWICRLARNAAADHARRSARRPAETSLDERHAAPVPPAPDDELREQVLRALGQLPEAYRETLFLRLAEGLSGPEIAVRTGLAPASVRVNLCRGMAMLRPLLREEDLP